MKDLKEYLIKESVECVETRDALEKYLTDNDIKFTINKEGRYDKSYDIIIDTNYEGVKVVYGFIGDEEYLASLEKDDKEIMYFESSKHLSSRNEFTVKFLDPLKYFNEWIKVFEKKLKSAEKGKRNNRTGEYEKNYSDIAHYKKKIANYTRWASKIK